ncbi:putative ribosomal RNA-processing protein Rrp9 [Helianthus anomalus]
MRNHKKFKNKRTQNGHKSKRLKSKKPDPFFTADSNRRKKFEDDDVSINCSDSDEYDDGHVAAAENGGESEEETAAEKRKRVAEAYLEKLRAVLRREEEDGEEVDERGGREDGDRDSMVVKLLQAKRLEYSGRIRTLIDSR